MDAHPTMVLGVNLNTLVPVFDIFLVEKFLHPLHELPATLAGNDLSGPHLLSLCLIKKLSQCGINSTTIFRNGV